MNLIYLHAGHISRECSQPRQGGGGGGGGGGDRACYNCGESGKDERKKREAYRIHRIPYTHTPH